MAYEFENPLIFGENADPSILVDHNEYYMVFSSCFGNYGLMRMWHSVDLINWTPLYYVLNGSNIGGAWAPDLIKYDNKYYIYNYAPQVGCFVTTCTDLKKGEWSKPKMIKEVEGIDPGHVVGEDGRRYLCMSKNYLYPLSEDGMEVTGEPVKIAESYEMPDEMDIEGMCEESPKFFQANGYYYLLTAQGGTMGPPTSHSVICYRSKNVAGPYEISPYTPLLHTKSRKNKWWSKGHGTIFCANDGNWYIVYHAIENGHRYTGRVTLLMPVLWDDNGWFTISEDDEKIINLPITAKKKSIAELLNYELGKSDRFSPLYNITSEQTKNSIKFTDNGIVITPVSNQYEFCNLITFSQQSHHYSYDLEITLFEDVSVSLGYWFHERMSCAMIASHLGIELNKHGAIHFPNDRIVFDVKEITLRMICNEGTVSFWYKLIGDKQFTKIRHAYDVADYNPNVSKGFGYARPNFSVYGNGSVLIKNIRYKDL